MLLVNVQNLALLDLGDAASVMPSDWDEKAMNEAAVRILEPARRRAASGSVAVSTRLEHGPIAETIVRIADEAGASQIVMGARGIGGVRGLLLGSVATQVVHLAKIPVTLIK